MKYNSDFAIDMFMDYPVGTIVYDPFCNTYVVKGVYYDSNNVKYYYVEAANDFFFNQPNPQCCTAALDALGRYITLPQFDCDCNGILRLLPDTALSLKNKPTKDNVFSPNR